MSITSYLSELESIKKELTRLNTITKDLRCKKSELEERIQNYLLQNNIETGVKFRGKLITVKQNTKRKAKNKREKHQDTAEILQKFGIRNASKIVEEILDAQRGHEIETNKLNIK
jgi:hypothetical protein